MVTGLLILTMAGEIRAQNPPPAPTPAPAASGETLRLRLKPLPTGARHVWLMPTADGGYVYHVERLDGTVVALAPEDFTRELYQESTGRGLLYRLLNITSPIGIAWVALGLLGQVLFTLRMVFQWLVSERKKRSVVPVGFWWMSLGGASMLLVYFVWRRDIVGILGQSTGWLIYVRNLWLIYHDQA
jgi:lipid-A-disaccharide synthase-like uncharacterized protein